VSWRLSIPSYSISTQNCNSGKGRDWRDGVGDKNIQKEIKHAAPFHSSSCHILASALPPLLAYPLFRCFGNSQISSLLLHSSTQPLLSLSLSLSLSYICQLSNWMNCTARIYMCRRPKLRLWAPLRDMPGEPQRTAEMHSSSTDGSQIQGKWMVILIPSSHLCIVDLFFSSVISFFPFRIKDLRPRKLIN
jgi:hypothetical protein